MSFKEKASNLKSWLLSKHFSYMLITLFTFRLIIFGAEFGDSLALISLVGLNAYNAWLKQQEQKPLELETRRQLEEMKNSLAALKMQNVNKSVRLDEQKTGRFF